MSGRLTASTLLGVAGILLATVWLPAAASAQGSPPNISITSAGPDASGDPYDLTVVADDGNGLPILSMTAHVYSAANQDVADVPMTAQSQTDPTDQVFAATSPIPEADLPPGTYTVTVEATDADEQDTGPDALDAPGSFTVTYTSSALSVVASPPSVTYGSNDVTFNGTLTGTAPGGTPIGIANAPVSVSISGGTPISVGTTDPNGNFSYPADGITQSADYDFTVPAAAGSYPAPADDDVTVGTDQSTTAVTVSADPDSVTEGEQSGVTFTGNVTVTPPPPAVQTPVGIGPGVPVYLNGSSSPVTYTTDAAGDFSYSPSGNAQPGSYAFSVASTSLYSGASNSATITPVAAPTATNVTATPAYVTFGLQSVTFSGTVTATPAGDPPVGIGSGVPVYLNGGSTPVTSTTDANGDFSYTVNNVSAALDDTFSVNADSAGLYSGSMDEVQVPVNPGKTEMTATATPATVDLGTSTVTFNGTVTVQPFGTTTPVSIGSGVPVLLSTDGGTATQVATTDGSGDFSYVAHGVTPASSFDFSVAAPESDLYGVASIAVPIAAGQVQSTLIVTPSPTSITEGAQTVTFTGVLTGQSPNGGSPVAIQGAPVDVSVNGGTATATGQTTDANGDFSYTVSNIGQQTEYNFSIPSSSSYTTATDDVTVAVSPATTQITGLTLSPSHVKYGQKITLKGTVQYQSGSTWTALPSAVVHLTENKTSLGSVTASKTGTFTATLPSTHGPGFTAMVNASTLLQQSTATGNLNIAVPLTVKSFSAYLSVNDKVGASGCLQVTAPVGYGPQTTVAIDYATSAHGKWKLLGRLPLHNVAGKYKSCPTADESYFKGFLTAKVANGYYRADFAATYRFQSAASKSVHAWKYRTRIVSYRVSPRTVSKGGVVTIKGRLETHRSSWRGWGDQKVTVLYNLKGSSFIGNLGSVRSSSRGYFTVQAKGGAGTFVAIIYARYGGNSTHLASQSSRVDVSIDNRSSEGIGPLDFAVGDPADLLIPMQPVLAPLVPALASLVR